MTQLPRVMQARYVVFVAGSTFPPLDPSPLPDAYREILWQPAWCRLVPPGEWAPRFYAWWLMHQLRGFRNRSYAALLVRHGREVVHRSLVFPAYFAFPFMSADDVQIGLVFTAPAHRGRGLATFAVREILRRFGCSGRRVWYVTESTNADSARVASSAGFSLVGEGVHRRRLGCHRLGYFELARTGVSSDAR